MQTNASETPWASIIGLDVARSVASEPKEWIMPETVPSSPTIGESVPTSERYVMRWFRLEAWRMPSVSAISRTAVEAGGGVVLGERQHGLHDARHGLAVAVADREQPQVIALAQQRLADVQVAPGNDGPPPQRQQIDEDEATSRGTATPPAAA